MDSSLHRRLVVVTGKGGVGKTTIAGAIGLLASEQGLRTLVVDLTGASRRLTHLFTGAAVEADGEPTGSQMACGRSRSTLTLR